LSLDHSTSAGTVTRPANRQSALKANFADRLRAAIARKGWTTTVVVHQVSRSLGNGNSFSRSHLWQYLHGRVLPRRRYLLALSGALGVNPEDLLPDRPDLVDNPVTPPGWADTVQVRDDGQGTALLDMSHRVPWQTAVKVIRTLTANEPSWQPGQAEGFAVAAAKDENG
jgi:transcriptional regulator with XRE-family HTH domain